ncbi:MAG: ComEC/Rec2 family competence protein [Spirochaetaceae bacterium]|nr:ComEC/Rec2 family competence protein [Spirochaetaceae bacterium]
MAMQESSIHRSVLLNNFFFSFIITYYVPWAVAGIFLFYSIFSSQKGKHILRVALLPGIILGLILNISLLYNFSTAHCGLENNQVRDITFQLDEDSFLSGNGKTIMKAHLLFVKNQKGVTCSSSGSVLIIDSREKNTFFWGEILNTKVELRTMKDSKEIFYIVYVQKEISHEGWVSPVYRLRKKLIEEVFSITKDLPENISALFNALYTGNTDLLDRELLGKFRESGVPHLLALSGFHVTIIVLIMTFLLQILIGRNTAFLMTIPLLLFYLFFAGPSPSLMRAVIMFLSGGFYMIMKRDVSIIQVLFITCIIQLTLSPVQGLSLSFQLSYLALAGILLLGKRFNFLFQPWIPGVIRAPLCASLGAHILTSPLLILQLGELYPIGILSSIIITPLITAFMWLSLCLFILNWVGFPEGLIIDLIAVCHTILDLTVKVVYRFSEFRGITFSSAGDISLYLSLLLIVVVSLYVQSWRKYGRRKRSQFKLRFTIGNKGLAGDYGVGAQKEMESEFSNQQRCQNQADSMY